MSICSHFGAQFTFDMCTAAKSCKNMETHCFGSSGSFKVINVDIIKKLVTNVCYDKQHVCTNCNCFHARRANSGKLTTFQGVTRI